MENHFYVYSLWQNGFDNPFYIGKGCHGRVYQHFSEARRWNGIDRFKFRRSGGKVWLNTAKLQKIRSGGAIVRILAEDLTNDEAISIEKYFIAAWVPTFEGGVLDNKTWGGEGNPLPDSVRERIAKSHAGKLLSESHKKSISEGLVGEANPFYGKTHSEASKCAISASRKGKALGSRNAMSRAEVRAKVTGQNNVNYNIKPYLTSSVQRNPETISLWKMADVIYSKWLEIGKRGYVLLAKAVDIDRPYRLLYMVNEFKSGWKPLDDPKWLDFKNDD